MCGIIGYTGAKAAAPIMLYGLKRLEYRGYDSCGMAVLGADGLKTVKAKGKISSLRRKCGGGRDMAGTVGIGHTRWATHGVPNETNSHPHASEHGRFVIVHNGIIENFAELKAELIAGGCTFKSETDSEVVAQLLEKIYDGDMISTLVRLKGMLTGSYALGILCVDFPDRVYAVKKDSPLIVGLGDGENFIVSDLAAALKYTRSFVFLENGDIAELSPASVAFYDASGAAVKRTPYTVDWNIKQAEKCGYPHYMLKEIYDQPKALTDTVRPRIKGSEIDLDGIELDGAYLGSITAIDIVGCGSAYHAGIVGKHFIEKHCRIPVKCELASEYIYSDPITGKNRLTIVISQSGETADSLAALRLAKKRGSRTLAIVNVVHSAIARDADAVLYTHAGPEIAVATTKGYTTQVAAMYLVGLKIARTRGTISDKRYAELLDAVSSLPAAVEKLLEPDSVELIKSYSRQFYTQHCVFFIGRGTDYAASLEGALKLKEISYIHAEAYAAGELKHGTISLVEKDTLTIAIVTQSELFGKMRSNVESVCTRDGTVLAVASPQNAAIQESAGRTLFIPECDDDVSPVLTAVMLQIFAYYVAVERGCDIDQPRNLAKSVTVE